MSIVAKTPSKTAAASVLTAPAQCNRSFAVAAIATVALAVLPAVLWPGAISWMCDEPLLLGQACYYNQAHQLANRGLGGTVGVAYGPFPTQFYQLLLLITHDVRVIVVLHAIFLTGLMSGSLLWLSRTLRLTPWFAAAIVLAPYLWWCQRVLWDASFMLSIGMMGVAAYASYLRTKSRTSLAVAVLGLTMAPLIHLMGLPLFGAFAIHAFVNFRRDWRRWALVPISLTIIAILNVSYARYTLANVTPRLHSIFKAGYVDEHQVQWPRRISFTGPFRSGVLFDGSTFEQERFRPDDTAINRVALTISQLATPIICLGILVAVMSLVWRRKTAKDGNDPSAASLAYAKSTLSRICLTALLFQILLAGALHIPPWPQYCFGTFPIHVFFGWLAIDFLQRFRLGIPLTLVWGSSLAWITLSAAWQVHENGWNRYLMSPTLGNQIKIVEQLNNYNDTTVWTDVDKILAYPMSLRDLRLIMPPRPGQAKRTSPNHLIIRYAAPDPSSQIELVESNGSPPDKTKFREMEVTPMPRQF